MSGQYLYQTLGAGVHVTDTSDPVNPLRLTFTRSEGCRDMAVAGNTAYIARWALGLVSLDLSDLPRWSQVDWRAMMGGAAAVEVEGDVAYVAAHGRWDERTQSRIGSSLELINISKPADLQLLGRLDLDLPGTADVRPAVSGGYFYVLTEENSQQFLTAVDIGDPTRPKAVGKLGGLLDARGLAVSGDYAYVADGRLRCNDVLVTDYVPIDLPVLAGVVTFEPATPNSHAAILAQSLHLPFAYAEGAGLQDQILALAGKEVLLVVEEDPEGNCEIRLTDVEGKLTEEEREQILELRQPPELAIRPMTVAGSISLPADPLTPEQVVFVGGKAANFGFLRRAIPESSPSPAIAFTFDLWNAYLDQPLWGGQTLREAIQEKLSRHTFPPEVTALRADLDLVRTLIKDVADFSPAQRQAILDALQDAGFNPARKILFRSSTNVEDTEHFTGAGLYDSYGGCLDDDTDGDSMGPCRCDPSEENERGVFRALRKVYASFYNENAFLVRLRFGIDESQVGMAVLVHHSFPDETEFCEPVKAGEIWGLSV